jgi:hypothetical protein
MQPQFSLQRIIKGDSAQLDRLFQAAASPQSAASLRQITAEKFCDVILAEREFDAALAEHVRALQAKLAQSIAIKDGFYCNPQDPLRLSLNLLLARGRTWYARDTRASQQCFDKLVHLMEGMTAADAHSVYISILEWFQAEDKRAAMLESRLCETEVNHCKLLAAECYVVEKLNQLLLGKVFPSVVIVGIGSTMKTELLHAHITLSADNPFGNKWLQLLPIIGAIFATITSASISKEETQKLYRTIPALIHELERSDILSASNPGLYRQWIDCLCEQLMFAIQKQAISCETFTALPYPSGHETLNTRVTSEVLQATQELALGDWVIISADDAQQIRGKLILNNAETSQMLFVDHTGRKVMSKSVKDVAICISAGIIKKLSVSKVDDVINKLISALIDHFSQKKVSTSTPLPTAKSIEPKPAVVRTNTENAPSSIVLASPQAAVEKALIEAEALAEAQAQAHQAQQLQTQLQLQSQAMAEQMQRIQLANIQISSLNLGARVVLVINQEPVACKLAVIIAASGKYIFVDNIGRKVAEYVREQLVQALLDNHLTLMNTGDSFDDQLARVIRSLRKDIS